MHFIQEGFLNFSIFRILKKKIFSLLIMEKDAFRKSMYVNNFKFKPMPRKRHLNVDFVFNV